METMKETKVLAIPFTLDQEPEIVLEQARRAAAALKTVLDQKPDKVIIGGAQYLEFEDWSTIARFYGLTAKEDGDPEYTQIGNVRGFKASAVAINRDGEVVSRATAFCLTDEEYWRERPVYEWGYICKDGSWSIDDPGKDKIVWEANPKQSGKNRPKKERRQTGVAPVPLFQLASMAQTRACAKAFRNVLSWVVVLAGYKPIPAEELPAPPGGAELPHQNAEVPPSPPGDSDVIASEAKPNTHQDLYSEYAALAEEAGELGIIIPPLAVGMSVGTVKAQVVGLKARIANEKAARTKKLEKDLAAKIGADRQEKEAAE